MAAEFNEDFTCASRGRSLSPGWPGHWPSRLCLCVAFVFVCFDGSLHGSQVVHSLNHGGCSPLNMILFIVIEAHEDRVELEGTWCGLMAIAIVAAAFFSSSRVASSSHWRARARVLDAPCFEHHILSVREESSRCPRSACNI